MSVATAPSDLLDQLSRGLRAYLLVACLAIAAALPGLTRMPVLDRDEARFAQATAQMLETGDFVRIWVQDEPRHKKPIGAHWLQAASVAAFSDVDKREIWAWRLPSVLATAVTAMAAFWLGWPLLGRRAAFLGALLLAASALLSTEGMIAKTDALLVATITLSLGAITRLASGSAQQPLLMAWMAWAALGAGVLIKGPLAPMTVSLAVAAFAVWERRWGWIKPLLDWRGPALFAIIVAPWFIAISLATDGAFLREAVLGDMTPKLTGGGEHPFTPPGAHTLALPILMFPASLGLVGAVLLGWRALRAPRGSAEGAPIRLLLAWALPTLLVFEAMPTKLAHYTLPIHPPLALLAGAGVLWLAGAGWRARWGSAVLHGIGAAGLVGLASVAAQHMPGDAAAGARRAAQTALTLGAVMAILVVMAAGAARRPLVATAIAALSAIVVMGTLRERILPEARTLLVSREAVLALHRSGLTPHTADAPLLVVGYRETSLVFETGSETILALAPQAATLAQPGQAVLLEAGDRDVFLTGLATRGLGFQPIGPAVGGLNYSNGERPRLQPGRITPQAASAPRPFAD